MYANPAAASSARTSYRWLVLGLMFLLYTLAFADRANVGIALPHIKAEFQLSNSQAGLIASLFSITYAVCQVPAAMLVRRFGPERIVPLFMGLTSVVAAFSGLAGSVIALQLSRALLGVVEAPLAISMATTINNWFAPREKGTAAGIFIASTKFAPLIVPPIGALIIAMFGWRHVFYVFAIPGVLFAIAWFFLVKDDPAKSRFVSASEADHIRDAGPSLSSVAGARATPAPLAGLDRLIRARRVAPLDTAREVFASWSLWGLALSYLFTQAVVGVILFLLPLYLTEVKGFSILNVGFVSASPFAGAVAGNLFGGLMSDRLFHRRRKPTMLITAASMIVMMWSLTQAPNDPVVLALLLFATGVSLSLGYSAYSVYPAPMTTKKAFPVAASLTNTMGQAGTALGPILTGLALDRYNWEVVFGGLSVCSLIVLVLLLTIVEPLEGPPQNGG